jgi:NAD(P)-dependent dehydrogenase (short-subunit alcohol dehydrogenase family)
VTKQGEVDAALALIEAEGRGLYGLVNNAGVFFGGPQTEVSVEDFQWLMDVNVFGVYRVTAAFAPLIIEAQGRITNISSISGINSSSMFGHYSASKHALEAMSDSLAAEVAELGVQVSVVEPGNYNSKIGETAYGRLKDAPFAKDGERYAAQIERMLNYIRESRDRYDEPDDVAEAILHSLAATDPLRRYMVVPNAGEANWAVQKAIDEVAEYSQWQYDRFSREELVEMLDDALSTRSQESTILGAMVDDFLAKTALRETHAAFWADDLIYTSSNGTRFGKQQIMEGFDEEPDLAADWPSYSAEDMVVRVHDKTGIVTFTLIGTPPAGSEEPVMRYYNTGTFLKRGGEWQAVAWQATIIPAVE